MKKFLSFFFCGNLSIKVAGVETPNEHNCKIQWTLNHSHILRNPTKPSLSEDDPLSSIPPEHYVEILEENFQVKKVIDTMPVENQEIHI